MAHAFRKRSGGVVACRLEAEEKAIIGQVTQETADLIREDLGLDSGTQAIRDAANSDDPLARLEAEYAARDARDPHDSAVRKLFPAASDDDADNAELRRLGQQDLACGKVADLQRLMRILDSSPPGFSDVTLREEDVLPVLRAFNDVRIVLADRLGIERDGDFETIQMMHAIAADVHADTGTTDPAAGHLGAGDLDDDFADLDANDPHMAGADVVAAIYELLSWLQESLLRSLD